MNTKQTRNGKRELNLDALGSVSLIATVALTLLLATASSVAPAMPEASTVKKAVVEAGANYAHAVTHRADVAKGTLFRY